MNEIDILKKQQLRGYKNAVLQIIKNNTKSLVEDDIMLLINKPPLDSMDSIKTKFISLAKKEKLVINNSEIDILLDLYRKTLAKDLIFIKKFRESSLFSDVEKFNPEKELDIIKITKKQLSVINKKINNECKVIILDNIEKILLKKMVNVFIEIDDVREKKIVLELTRFLKNTYKKQLLENISFKVLVKDTTLINGVREQGERYIFTITNSRLNDLN